MGNTGIKDVLCNQLQVFCTRCSVSCCKLGVLFQGSEQPGGGLAPTPAKTTNYIFHLDKNGGCFPMLLIIMRGI